MHSTTIFNRYTKQFEQEAVFGENFLKFLYGSSVGRLAVGGLFKRKFFSSLFGLYANSSLSASRVGPFVRKYGIHSDAFKKKIDDFKSFNDFFIRELHPNARPISKQEGAIAAPVDGRMLAYESLADTTPFFVKGESLSVDHLLRDSSVARDFRNCSMLIARLCPTDYHRFHFPMDCIPQKTYLIKGAYSSVHPIATRGSFSVFLQNKRTFTMLRTDMCSNVIMLEVGATCVGSIQQTFAPFKKYAKGEEKGYFQFGGSTVILLFRRGTVKFSEDILENTSEGVETYVLMGDTIATIA